MNKTEFQSGVRQELRKVPLAIRQEWTDNALLAWWLKTTNEYPYLAWDKCHGDPWQYVHIMCTDMIGDRAIV